MFKMKFVCRYKHCNFGKAILRYTIYLSLIRVVYLTIIERGSDYCWRSTIFLLHIGEIIRKFPRNKRKFSSQEVELNIKETENKSEDERSREDVKERYVVLWFFTKVD